MIVILILARKRLADILSELVNKLRSSSELKIGYIEIKGVSITEHGKVLRGQKYVGFEVLPASADEYRARHDIYARQRNLMLVHTIRPAEPEEWIEGHRVYDTSIFLHYHQGFGRINDVKGVTYYLGDHWGESRYGTKFMISNGSEQFALTASACGSFLCVAEVEFQDGESVRIQRYIDTEMAPVYPGIKR